MRLAPCFWRVQAINVVFGLHLWYHMPSRRPIIENAKFGIDRLAQHHLYPSFPRFIPALPHLQSEINTTIFVQGCALIGRYINLFLPAFAGSYTFFFWEPPGSSGRCVTLGSVHRKRSSLPYFFSQVKFPTLLHSLRHSTVYLAALLCGTLCLGAQFGHLLSPLFLPSPISFEIYGSVWLGKLTVQPSAQ